MISKLFIHLTLNFFIHRDNLFIISMHSNSTKPIDKNIIEFHNIVLQHSKMAAIYHGSLEITTGSDINKEMKLETNVHRRKRTRKRNIFVQIIVDRKEPLHSHHWASGAFNSLPIR
jgi:hypothetical protein